MTGDRCFFFGKRETGNVLFLLNREIDKLCNRFILVNGKRNIFRFWDMEFFGKREMVYFSEGVNE